MQKLKFFLSSKWTIAKYKLAEVFRPAFGYKYKIVYTELEINGKFKRRYMSKLKVDESNSRILDGLPKVNGAGYIAPYIFCYSKTDRLLGQRMQLKEKDLPILVFKAFFM